MFSSTNPPRVIAAMLTPCTQPGEPDLGELAAWAQRLVAGGCDGLFVGSSTGELPMLGREHRRSMVTAVTEAAGGTATVYAGISATGVPEALEHAHDAAAAGADVAVVMAPFFLKLAPAELQTYFLEIADGCPVPLALYHHLRMPTGIGLDTARRLAAHQNVVAIKDSARDVDRIGALASMTGWRVYQGSEYFVLESLELGATGCVSALAGAVPEWHRDLVDAWERGDRQGAEAAQARLNELAAMYTFDALGRGFTSFAHAVRRAAQCRGMLDAPHGMTKGFEPDPEFDRQLDALFARIGLGESDIGTK